MMQHSNEIFQLMCSDDEGQPVGYDMGVHVRKIITDERVEMRGEKGERNRNPKVCGRMSSYW